MGKKVSPHSIRIGITRKWDSTWYASGVAFKNYLIQDLGIRKHLKKKLEKASLAKVEIKRGGGKTSVILHSGKPGVIIGRSGENIENLSKDLRGRFGDNSISVSVQEVRKPDADAQLIADNIAEQIERRFPYRRVCKMALERAKEAGVKGIKLKVGGRLNGVDIARSETYTFGTVPLHTLRANIDYATSTAPTMYGAIGIKVWVYHGMVFKNQELN
jgi:small subunit ribosomal protein S3